MPLVPCPACGHSVSDQAPFCPRCGHPLRPAPAQPPLPPVAAVPAPVPAPAPEPEPPDPLRCICGTWNRVGALRCASCSRPLGQWGTGRGPVQYVHAPLTVSPPDPEGERRGRDDQAAETLGTVSVVCAAIAILIWPLVFGLIALACGIPAYLRGSRRGLTGIVLAIVAMGLSLLVALLL